MVCFRMKWWNWHGLETKLFEWNPLKSSRNLKTTYSKNQFPIAAVNFLLLYNLLSKVVLHFAKPTNVYISDPFISRDQALVSSGKTNIRAKKKIAKHGILHQEARRWELQFLKSTQIKNSLFPPKPAKTRYASATSLSKCQTKIRKIIYLLCLEKIIYMFSVMSQLFDPIFR